MNEGMQDAQVVIGIAHASEFADRSLVIVINLGDTHRFVGKEATTDASGIGSSVIHVVTDAIGSRAKGTYHQCLGRTSIYHGTAFVNHLYAHTHLGTKRGVEVGVVTHGRVVRFVLDILEQAEGRHRRFCPKGVGVRGRNRNSLVAYDCCIAPTGSGVERSNHACLFGHALQGEHVLFAQFRCLDFLLLLAHAHHGDVLVISGTGVVGSFARIVDGPRGGTMLVFVLNLNTNNRASILIVQSAQLTSDFSVKSLNILQIVGIVGTYIKRLGKKPIGQSSVAYLAMAEGAYTHNDVHPMLLAQLYKMTQVEVVIPTEASFFFFVHIPKNIDGDNRQSTCFHLQHRLFPLCTRETAIMEFTSDRYHGTSVFCHIITVHFHTASVRSCTTQLQVAGMYLFRSSRLGQLISLLGFQSQCTSQSQQKENTLFHILFLGADFFAFA